MQLHQIYNQQTIVAFLLLLVSCSQESGFEYNFDNVSDRVWIGENFWAIPMEDWRVKEGRLELTGQHPRSRVIVLTHVIDSTDGEFAIKVKLGFGNLAGRSGSAGLSVGIHDPIDGNIKAAAYYGKGIDAGVDLAGFIFLDTIRQPLPNGFDLTDCELMLSGTNENGNSQVSLLVSDVTGKKSEITSVAVNPTGMVALVSHFRQGDGGPIWFDDLRLSGSRIVHRPENSFGPILWTMYTLSRNVLNLSAQMPPLSHSDGSSVSLLIKRNGQWAIEKNAAIDSVTHQALFRISDWDPEHSVDYRIEYETAGKVYAYDGTIRAEPVDRPLTVAGLTCQEHGGYPYTPLVQTLASKDPDLLFFSGDQLYEGNGGYPIKREPEDAAILSYLGKWYMFGWAFRDLMKDRPTICTPDDHDVFQGNLWGEDGKLISVDDWKLVQDAHGGYVQTPAMVNVVYKTQCAHLPNRPDPTALPSGIDVWFTDLVYGDVSFAIISDRMFKSGPEKIFQNQMGRIDHVTTPTEPDELDKPGLGMLGVRQIAFLEQWIEDWKDARMKVLLSQTVFSNIPTHHGSNRMILYGDLDSGGWPKAARDSVIRLMRKAFVFHLNGDQHIPMIVRYGLNDYGDAGWSFCTPAISTGYMRGFYPDSLGFQVSNRPDHGYPNTGEYTDGFGNKNFVYAVSSPPSDISSHNRYVRVTKKMSGFGIVTFDTSERTISMEAFPFLSRGEQFPGWPLTIGQLDNDGRRPSGYLPLLRLSHPDAVVKIIHQGDGRIVNVHRIKGTSYQPPVYEPGVYEVVVGEGNGSRKLSGLQAKPRNDEEIVVNW